MRDTDLPATETERRIYVDEDPRVLQFWAFGFAERMTASPFGLFWFGL